MLNTALEMPSHTSPSLLGNLTSFVFLISLCCATLCLLGSHGGRQGCRLRGRGIRKGTRHQGDFQSRRRPASTVPILASFTPDCHVEAVFQRLSSENAWPQHTKTRICYPRTSLLIPTLLLASRGRVVIQLPFLCLGRWLWSKKVLSQPSRMPMLHGRPKFWHPSPKTWHCVQTGLMWRCSLPWDQILQHGGNKPWCWDAPFPLG